MSCSFFPCFCCLKHRLKYFQHQPKYSWRFLEVSTSNTVASKEFAWHRTSAVSAVISTVPQTLPHLRGTNGFIAVEMKGVWPLSLACTSPFSSPSPKTQEGVQCLWSRSLTALLGATCNPQSSPGRLILHGPSCEDWLISPLLQLLCCASKCWAPRLPQARVLSQMSSASEH